MYAILILIFIALLVALGFALFGGGGGYARPLRRIVVERPVREVVRRPVRRRVTRRRDADGAVVEEIEEDAVR